MGLEVPPAEVEHIDGLEKAENLFSKVVALKAEWSSKVAKESVTFLGTAGRVEQRECVTPDVGEVGTPESSDTQ